MISFLAIVAVLASIGAASYVAAQSSLGNPKHGQAIYEELCLRCHGAKLDGAGPEAQYLKIRPADLQSLSSRVKSDWELMVIIAHGVMFTPMHGFRDVLTEQDMRDVLSYLRHMAPFKPIS